MTINISAFRSAVSNNTGYIKADSTDNSVTKFGNGYLGKIAAWFRGPDKIANKATKENFILTLKQTYGDSFPNNKALAVLGYDHNRFMNSSKPLSARLARDLISAGDTMLKAKIEACQRQFDTGVSVNDGKEIIKISSSYKDTDSLHKASDSFLKQAKFDKEGSNLLRNIVSYINRPSDAKLYELTNGPGAAGSSKFAKAFVIGDDAMAVAKATHTRELEHHCATINVNPSHISNAALSLMQIPTRFNSLSETLAKTHDTGKLKHVLDEILMVTNNQIKTVQNGIKALSHPNVFDGISKKDAEHLTSLKKDLESCLLELCNPDGPYQHFIAFAVVASSDLTTALNRLKAEYPVKEG